MPIVVLYQGVFAVMPANAEPLLPAPGREGIKNFAEAMRSRIRDAGSAKAWHAAKSPANPRITSGKHEHDQHRHLHVVGFDLLAQIFRRAAHHEPGNEDRQHDVRSSMPYMPGADAAEDHLAQHDVDQRNHSAERREGIVPSVDRAATRIGRHGGQERGVGDAEANFLAFHVSARLHSAGSLIGSASSGLPRASAQ